MVNAEFLINARKMTFRDNTVILANDGIGFPTLYTHGNAMNPDSSGKGPTSSTLFTEVRNVL